MCALVQAGVREDRSITQPLVDPEARQTGTTIASHDEIRRVTPFPKLQVSVIAVTCLSETVAATFVYPFINERLSEMSSSPKELARLSGLLFACYAFAQFVSAYFWGTFSDRVGRKPILLACLLICAISTVGFGAGNTFLEILIFRTRHWHQLW
ncbi:hypothetical protein BS47DRAFT_631803 [Hydnum rufescens UP504]|uniref:Major facilitator superfamily (MFS) profile domain-containing protein n=1 Tax=Hydnum rufescens UP504 TaxID=1448309 RepID=A0A9P6DNH8_9AGAM|nr:hypothetical protein BS47DRAFT_631803 [Hydnum rufescens UP504]